MNKLDAIIHIGFNKCGSTAIQAWLDEATAELADQGVFYLRTDPRPDRVCGNHHLSVLAHTLAGNLVPFRRINAIIGLPPNDMETQIAVAQDYQAKLSQLVNRDGAKAFVASAESLISRNFEDAQIKALHGFLTKTFRSVKYIAYIRRPAAWMVSLYGHEHRAKRTQYELNEFVEKKGIPPYRERLKRWSNVVGEDAIDVRLFHENWVSGPGLIADFATLLPANVALADEKFSAMNISYNTRRGLFKNPRDIKRPQRPKLSASVTKALMQNSAPDLDWIEQTFFADRHAEFESWKA